MSGITQQVDGATVRQVAYAYYDGTDSQVAPYADNYYQYDSSQRVTLETVQAAGSSATGGGLGTYSYSYTTSTNSAGYNSWQTKTTESLPDGTTHTVFTNYAGEVMLASVSSGGQTWNTFHAFDTQGRDVLDAMPSAVTGYSQTYADLLDKVSGNYFYLSDTAGLVALTDYGSSTTATSSSAGNVSGYLADTKVEHGETGTPVTTFSEQYFARAGDEGTIYPVASTTDYPNANGSGSQTTSYSYAWEGTSDGEASETVTLPVVSSGQNGPGTADTSTTVFDTYGDAEWTKDGGGFLTYPREHHRNTHTAARGQRSHRV
jgi:hypothetical protein